MIFHRINILDEIYTINDATHWHGTGTIYTHLFSSMFRANTKYTSVIDVSMFGKGSRLDKVASHSMCIFFMSKDETRSLEI